MDIKLAIVIPFYKLTFFEETLKSLAGQTDKRFNVYIGDDGSPESPRVILKKYNSQLNIIYHRFEKNLGKKSLTQQWDRCISMAKEEPWLMILGDDDVIGKGVVSSFYKHYFAFNEKYFVIRFATKVINEITETTSSIYQQPLLEDAYTSFYRRITGGNRSTLSEHIFSKEKYEKFGFVDYPLAWYTDDRAWLDFTDGLPIYSVNEATVFIRISNEHISGKTDNLKEKHRSQLLFYSYLVNKKIFGFTKQQQTTIFSKYQKSIFANNKIAFRYYLNLCFIYLKYFKIKEFIGLKVNLAKHFLKKLIS